MFGWWLVLFIFSRIALGTQCILTTQIHEPFSTVSAYQPLSFPFYSSLAFLRTSCTPFDYCIHLQDSFCMMFLPSVRLGIVGIYHVRRYGEICQWQRMEYLSHLLPLFSMDLHRVSHAISNCNGGMTSSVSGNQFEIALTCTLHWYKFKAV